MATAQPLIQEIITKVSGEQELRSLISGLQAQADALNKVKKASEGAVSTHKDVGKEMRVARMATAQLGMQFSQISTQMQSGTSGATIFAQQIGDVGFAMSNMGGAMGVVGRFLSGPWGVALTIGTMALMALKGGADDAKDSTVGFAEYGKAALTLFGEAAAPIAEMAFAPFGPAIDFVKENIGSLVQFAETALNVVVQALAGVAVAIVQTIGRTPDIIKGVIYAAINGVIHMINFAQDVVAGFINTTYSAVKRLVSYVGLEMPAFEVKFKPFSTKESGLGATFGAIDSAMTKAVTTKYFDLGAIAALAPSFVKKDEGKKKGGSKDNAAKSEADAFNASINAANEAAMKGVEEYSKNFSQTTRETVKQYVDAWTQAYADKKQLEDYYWAQSREAIDAQKDAIASFSSTVSDGFKSLITGAGSFRDLMHSAIQSVIDELWKLYVVKQLTGFISKTVGGALGLTGKAIGGSVQSGQPYMVGERGPEMFIPSRSGSIVPNKGLGGGMVINVDARGSTDAAAVRQQVQQGIMEAAPMIIAAAQSRTLASASRARLPGTIS